MRFVFIVLQTFEPINCNSFSNWLVDGENGFDVCFALMQISCVYMFFFHFRGVAWTAYFATEILMSTSFKIAIFSELRIFLDTCLDRDWFFHFPLLAGFAIFHGRRKGIDLLSMQLCWFFDIFRWLLNILKYDICSRFSHRNVLCFGNFIWISIYFYRYGLVELNNYTDFRSLFLWLTMLMLKWMGIDICSWFNHSKFFSFGNFTGTSISSYKYICRYNDIEDR